MIVYAHGYFGTDPEHEFTPLIADGHEIQFLDPSMSAQQIYDHVMGADAVVLQYDDDNAERGTVLGLALAFGKPVGIVVKEEPLNPFVWMDSDTVHGRLAWAIKDLRDRLSSEEKDDGTARLEELGGDPGDGSDEPGTTG